MWFHIINWFNCSSFFFIFLLLFHHFLPQISCFLYWWWSWRVKQLINPRIHCKQSWIWVLVWFFYSVWMVFFLFNPIFIFFSYTSACFNFNVTEVAPNWLLYIIFWLLGDRLIWIWEITSASSMSRLPKITTSLLEKFTRCMLAFALCYTTSE